MDQSKFRIPRVRERQSKLFQRLFRPTLHCIGCWLHGWRFEFAISDEDLKKDSETQMEVISRGLSNMYEAIGDMPAGLVLQQDNCAREGKNRYTLNYLLLLVALRVCRWAAANFLRTGHSGLAVLPTPLMLCSDLEVMRTLTKSSANRLPLSLATVFAPPTTSLRSWTRLADQIKLHLVSKLASGRRCRSWRRLLTNSMSRPVGKIG